MQSSKAKFRPSVVIVVHYPPGATSIEGDRRGRREFGISSTALNHHPSMTVMNIDSHGRGRKYKTKDKSYINTPGGNRMADKAKEPTMDRSEAS